MCRSKNDPWGAPGLNGYFCEGVPSRTTRSCLLLRKGEIRPNIWQKVLQDLSFWRRPVCQTLSKALDISFATALVAPGQSKDIAILSDTTVRISVVDWKDLKPC